jgi:transcriptional regulator with XRE-family HTH domain
MLDGLEIKTRRVFLKMKQDEFAQKLGISRQYLSRLESGRERVSENLEAKYNELFGTKRLVSITTGRGVECPRCHGTSPLEKLSEPKDELNTVYHCADCGNYFTIGESWGLHYRP